ncbi:MAG: hypothetical protein AABY27_00840 [Pseudomonadota bacterium]
MKESTEDNVITYEELVEAAIEEACAHHESEDDEEAIIFGLDED